MSTTEKIFAVRRGDGGVSNVVIGSVIDRLREYLPKDRRVIIITDTNVADLHGKRMEGYEKIVIGLGEENKTHTTLVEIYSQLIAMGADRSCFILGFGGGIVTDIAGFVASTYMRGMRFGFVATTLLAQVDASVGGKNGVNVDGYKNMVGVFNQPEFVLCDTSVLQSLPKREFRSGLAEIIKAGLILDCELFEIFEKHLVEDFLADDALLTEVVSRAVAVKKQVVEADERETGERKKLNLGHTFGHAIEKCSRRFIHGEAVAIGICTAADASVSLGMLSADDALRIRTVMERMGLPVTADIRMERLLDALRSDKKKSDNTVSLILLGGIGRCFIRKTGFDEIPGMID